MGEAEGKAQSWLVRRAGPLAAVLLLVAIAIFAGLMRPTGRAPAANGASLDASDAAHATDGPGADALYGFEPAELDQHTPHELIAAALQNTTLDAIDADAKRGDALGQALMCFARAYGEGLPKNLFIARSACEAAQSHGSAIATYQLSLFMREGDAGYRESRAQADRALRRAADAGDVRARTDLAAAAVSAGRAHEGYDVLVAAAEHGYRPAELALGALYEEGRGVPRDPRTALLWYSRAAEAGSQEGREAMARLRGASVIPDSAQR